MSIYVVSPDCGLGADFQRRLDFIEGILVGRMRAIREVYRGGFTKTRTLQTIKKALEVYLGELVLEGDLEEYHLEGIEVVVAGYPTGHVAIHVATPESAASMRKFSNEYKVVV